MNVAQLQELARAAIGSFQPAAPLDESVREAFEGLFGVDFRAVRIHVAPTLAESPVRAFAFGNDLYFAPGEFSPETPDGRATLAHELAHVVQQRCGRTDARVAARWPRVLVDPGLESEADRAALVAVAPAGSRQPLPPALRTVALRATVNSPVIQFLMKLEEFKSNTRLNDRSGLSQIDLAISEFHTSLSRTPPNATKALQNLRAVIDCCRNYKASHFIGGSVAAVNLLLKQATSDLEILSPLGESAASTTFATKWKYYQQACGSSYGRKADPYSPVMTMLHNYRKALFAGYFSDSYNDSNYVYVTRFYLDKFASIAQKSSAPRVLRNVMQELLDSTLLSKCDLEYGSSSAFVNGRFGLPQKEGTTRSYVVRLAYDREASEWVSPCLLAHELMHVSVSESFKNSPIMLSILPAATEDQMADLAQKRQAQINRIIELMADSNSITSRQDLHSFCKDKLGYAIGGKIETYLNLLKDFFFPEFKSLYEKLLKLYLARRMRTELVEYDTVINQCLLGCYLVGIPDRSSALKALIAAAEEAYHHRAAGRRGQHLA